MVVLHLKQRTPMVDVGIQKPLYRDASYLYEQRCSRKQSTQDDAGVVRAFGRRNILTSHPM